MTALGDYVRAERKRRGLSQAMLARRALIDPAHVNHMERGQVVWPGPFVLLRLAAALRVSPLEIAERALADFGGGE